MNKIEVIYIRHDDGEDSDLTKGKEGFNIDENIKPIMNEMIFDKTVNSAFKDSGLLDYLKNKGENKIILAGLQTDYCIDATVKAGFEYGFQILIPEYANTTTDNPYMTGEQTYDYYNKHMWNNRYGQSISMDAVLSIIIGKE